MPARSGRAAQTRPCASGLIDPTKQLSFARCFARCVAQDFGLSKGGQEEAELVATAYLVVVEYAPKFDPLKGCRVRVEAACRRWRRGSPVPAVSGPVVFAGEDLALRVAAIAGRIAARRKFGRGSGERAALLLVGLWAAAEWAVQFDATRAFRGWVSVEIRSRCRREAIRLQNGGTFHTSASAEANAMRIEGLPRPTVAGQGHEHDATGHGPPAACDTTLYRDCRFDEPDEEFEDEDGPPVATRGSLTFVLERDGREILRTVTPPG